jgi:hypothetical protein
MKLLFPALLLAGCASEPDRIEPVLTETTGAVTFDLHGFEHTFVYDLDGLAETMTGSRISLRGENMLCRSRVDNVASLGVERTQRLRLVLEDTDLITLGEDSCDALELGCGGGGSSLSVRVDGGEIYNSETPCRQVASSYDLVRELDLAFGTLVQTHEQIAWNGTDFDVIGPCPDFTDGRASAE